MVTNEQLDKDIDNTILEFYAYEKLESGYSILADLPENAGMASMLLRAKAQQNKTSARICKELLDKLFEIKKARLE